MQKADGRAYLIVDDALYGKAIVPYQMAGVEDTIEDLEKSLGMPEGQLVHTFESYNRAAERRRPGLPQGEQVRDYISSPPYGARPLGHKSVWGRSPAAWIRRFSEVLG
jgi:3-oxo-5alpha-steroid 4-dehydrogenase